MTNLRDNKMSINLSSITETAGPLIIKALGWAALFLAPIKPVLFAVGFLVLVDLITGLYASHKRNEKITSNGIRRTITKTLAYMAAVICSHVMETVFLNGIPVVKVVGGLIAITEFQSLMENISSITKIDLWKAILEKLQGQKIIPELKEALPQIEAPKEEPKIEEQVQPVAEEKPAKISKKKAKKKIKVKK